MTPEVVSRREAAPVASRAPSKTDEEAWDVYWDFIRELHGRDDDSIWSHGVTWCQSTHAWERWLGIDILSQYGCLAKGETTGRQDLPMGVKETVPGWPDTPLGLRAQHIIGLCLTDPDADVVASALSALPHLGGAGDFLPQLWPLLAHPCEHVRHTLTLVLEHHSDHPHTQPALIALSQDEIHHVRDWATFALGNLVDFHAIDTPALRDALAARLEDSDSNTRGEALVALALLRDPRVMAPLREALAADEVGTLAVQAAETLQEPSLLPLLLNLRLWWDVDPLLLERAIVACGGESEMDLDD